MNYRVYSWLAPGTETLVYFIIEGALGSSECYYRSVKEALDSYKKGYFISKHLTTADPSTFLTIPEELMT